MIQELACVLLTEAACDLGERHCDSALAACERALQLAAPRGYRLIYADASNLRARLMLERPEPDPSRARDDAEAALQLAETSEYAWAQRDALELLARAHRGARQQGRSPRQPAASGRMEPASPPLGQHHPRPFQTSPACRARLTVN